jgi:hypothetical protein
VVDAVLGRFQVVSRAGEGLAGVGGVEHAVDGAVKVRLARRHALVLVLLAELTQLAPELLGLLELGLRRVQLGLTGIYIENLQNLKKCA